LVGWATAHLTQPIGLNVYSGQYYWLGQIRCGPPITHPRKYPMLQLAKVAYHGMMAKRFCGLRISTDFTWQNYLLRTRFYAVLNCQENYFCMVLYSCLLLE